MEMGGGCKFPTAMSTTELLEIPEVREHISLMSVEEYHKTGERNARGRRTELVRGIVIEKMPKSPEHRWIAYTLLKLIERVIGGKFLAWMDQPLTFIDSEPEPDIAVVIGPDTYRHEHPHTAFLVIEVAVTSLALDRAKAEIYAETGIPEYWIVNVPAKSIEVYTQIAGGRYSNKENYLMNGTIQCQSVRDLTLEVATLFPD